MTTKKVGRAERRAEPRVRADGIIGVRMHTQTGLHQGTLVDLNNGGAFIATSLQPEPGTPLVMELEIPGSPRFSPIRALVVRSKTSLRYGGDETPCGIAVKFLAESLDGRERIYKVVQTVLLLDILDEGLR